MKRLCNTIKTEEECFFLFASTFQLMRTHAEHVLQAAGLSLPEYLLLRIVHASPGVTASEICDVLHATPPTVAHTVANLERRKLLSRTTDKNDARRQHLRLSPNGRRLVLRGKRDINAFARSLGLRASFIQSAGKACRDLQEKIEKVGE